MSAENKDRANRYRDGSVLGNTRPAGYGEATLTLQVVAEPRLTNGREICLPGLWPRIPASSDDVHIWYDW